MLCYNKNIFRYDGFDYYIAATEKPGRLYGFTTIMYDMIVSHADIVEFWAIFGLDKDKRLIAKEFYATMNESPPLINGIGADSINWRNEQGRYAEVHYTLHMPLQYHGRILLTANSRQSIAFQEKWEPPTYKDAIELTFEDNICVQVKDVSNPISRERSEDSINGYRKYRSRQKRVLPGVTCHDARESSQERIAINDEQITFGGFKWRVLERQRNKVLLLSELIIEKRPYHMSDDDIDWEHCSLRKYLNDDFLNKFDEKEKSLMLVTEVINNNNPRYGTAGGKNTHDRFFLLSIDEVLKYYGERGELKNKRYAPERIDDKLNSVRIAKDAGGQASMWLLRSPGVSNIGAALVNSTGIISMMGALASSPRCGIRPAIWLKLNISI